MLNFLQLSVPVEIVGSAGTVSLAAIFFVLFRQERTRNRVLSDRMLILVENNTKAMTDLTSALHNRSLCPLTGNEALGVLDSLRRNQHG